MDRTHWQQLSALLDEALALPAAERARWLAGLRGRDAALAEQLERMLAQAGDDDEGEQGGAPAAALDLDLAQARTVAGGKFEQWLGQALAAGSTVSGPGRDTVTLPLQRCGSWQLLHKIGEGGMGQVWLARRADGLYEAQAAIKLLRSDVRATRLADRFARERAVLARLNHPAVARLLDAGIDNGRAFLVLELVQGRALADHVREHCPTVADRVRLMIRIAEGVEHAHAQLIVHRDLKPSNVLVNAAGDPKLLDFGIAGVLDAEGQAGDEQLTRQIGRMLTPAYAAPEQVRGDPIGIAADIFSLCVMLYELLSGELPFAPRDAERSALEHALLHKEPRRLSQTHGTRTLPWRRTRTGTGPRTGTRPDTPGGTQPGPAPAAAATAPRAVVDGPLMPPPLDFAKVRGDLEAVVAKGLSKRPEDRYGSVRALILDLERWLSHRPVSVRRDDWRHRVHLWLRRNALLAGTGGLVTAVMLGGLAMSTWQWRRAEQAARESEQVTQYLGELLASASPDRHGGQLPSLLTLLDTSRQEVATRFADEPHTLLRLQEVLGSTYHALNRFDLAIPLLEQRLALALRTHGPEAEATLAARMDVARGYTATGTPQRVVQELAPLLPRLRAEPDPGRRSSALYMLAVAQAHLARFDEAQRHLDEAWPLVQAQYPAEDFRRVFFANYVALLRSAQGRLGEAEATLAATRPAWATAPKAYARFVLVLRRSLLNTHWRLGRYADYEAPARALLQDMDALLGRGNDMSLLQGQELGRFLAEAGRPGPALRQYREAEQRLEQAGVQHAMVRLPLEAQRLLMETLANDGQPLAQLLGRARQVLEQIDREPLLNGLRRAEAWIALTRLALLQGDPWLAGAALERLRADGSALGLAQAGPLRGRVEQLEGQLLRQQGNLVASRDTLQRRLGLLAGWTERQVMPVWAAQLDLATTLVLMNDPGAAAALAEADALRPPQLPTDHPLDALRRYLQARLAAGRDDTEALRVARAALERAWGRGPGQLPSGLGGLMP